MNDDDDEMMDDDHGDIERGLHVQHHAVPTATIDVR